MTKASHYTIPDMEDAAIGLCVINPAEVNTLRTMIADEKIFYQEENRILFRTIIRMKEEFTPIDMFTIGRELMNVPHPAGERWSYIIAKKIQPVTGQGQHLRFWCACLIECYAKRLTEGMQSEAASIEDPFERAKFINDSLNKAMNLTAVDDWSDASQIALQLTRRMEEIDGGKEFGVKTGFRELDQLTGGLQTGFHVIAARPAMGKTAFALSLALNMAENRTPVGIMSLEMPNVQLAARIAAQISGFEFWRIFRSTFENEGQKGAFLSQMAKMASLPMYFSDQTSVKGTDIRYKAEKLVKAHGAKCLIIDYLQLVDTESTNRNYNRQNEVQKLSRTLKTLSNELDIPIIALAQLNRESETSDKVSKPGKLSQLRESGAIEQDVDMGIIIDRPHKRGETSDETGASTEGVAYIDVQKHRNGEERNIKVYFHPKTMRFSDHPEFESANHAPPSDPSAGMSRPQTAPNLLPIVKEDLPF